MQTVYFSFRRAFCTSTGTSTTANDFDTIILCCTLRIGCIQGIAKETVSETAQLEVHIFFCLKQRK